MPRDDFAPPPSLSPNRESERLRQIHLMLPKNFGILRGHGSFSPVERRRRRRGRGERDREGGRETRHERKKTKAEEGREGGEGRKRGRGEFEVLTKLRGKISRRAFPPSLPPAHSPRPQSPESASLSLSLFLSLFLSPSLSPSLTHSSSTRNLSVLSFFLPSLPRNISPPLAD